MPYVMETHERKDEKQRQSKDKILRASVFKKDTLYNPKTHCHTGKDLITEQAGERAVYK